MREQSVVAVAVVALLLLASALALTPGRFQFTQSLYSTTEDFGVAYITVQRNLGFDGRAAVYVSTLLASAGGGNAVAGRDFKPVFNRSLVWQNGDDLEKELYVRILNDGQPQEQRKTFTLYLHDALGGQINPERNVTQIVLEPPSNLLPGSFRLLNATLDANETIVSAGNDASAFAIPVLWENGTTSTARVAFEIVCDSACGPNDVTVLRPANQLLEWTRAGPRIQTILLAIPDDDVYEQLESFRVRLKLVEAPVDSSLLGSIGVGSLGAINEVVVRITGPNDVHAGVVQFQAACFPACASITYTVHDGGAAHVVLQRRNGSDSAASVTLRTVDGTALANVDYKPLTTVVKWSEGDAADKVVVVQALADVVRHTTKRFALELVDSRGATLAGRHASRSFVDTVGPSNVVLGEVNFAVAEPLASILKRPDESFVPIVTRLDSHLRQCPRLVVTAPGVVELLVQRNFANVVGSARVTLRAVDGTALSGVDYEALTPAASIVEWTSGDAAATKRVQLSILAPRRFDTHTRSFAIEIASVTNVALGQCHRIDVDLQSIGAAPHIVAFDLNMNTRQLTLTLSHPVLAATLDASKLQLQTEAASTAVTIVVTSGSSTPHTSLQLSRESTTTATADSTRIVLDMSVSQMHALKMTPVLAKSAATVYLSAQPGVFEYVLDNCASPISSACTSQPLRGTASPLGVSTFVADTVRPELLSFSLDLTQQLLKLRFSEPVDRARVHVDALALSDTRAGGNVYRLTPGATREFRPTPMPLAGALQTDATKLPTDGTYVTLLLSADDVNALRAFGNKQIGENRGASTFLSLTSDFVSDLAIPPNAVVAIESGNLLQAAATDCSACPAGSFLAASCSDTASRVCAACSVCPRESFALEACTATRDTVCYPCTECRGAQYATVQCTPTTDRECVSCTKCTRDEFEASPCINGVNRICRTCDSCLLTKEQQRQCDVSTLWRRRLLKAPYACPRASQKYKTREARLQRAKSNACGAGRCSCSNSGVGNYNPRAESFPDDDRCTEPAVYNIFL